MIRNPSGLPRASSPGTDQTSARAPRSQGFRTFPDRSPGASLDVPGASLAPSISCDGCLGALDLQEHRSEQNIRTIVRTNTCAPVDNLSHLSPVVDNPVDGMFLHRKSTAPVDETKVLHNQLWISCGRNPSRKRESDICPNRVKWDGIGNIPLLPVQRSPRLLDSWNILHSDISECRLLRFLSTRTESPSALGIGRCVLGKCTNE